MEPRDAHCLRSVLDALATRGAGGRDRAELEAGLLVWWSAEGRGGESLSDFLVREKALSPAAGRTLELDRKGYVRLDPRQRLIDEEAIDRIERALARIESSESAGGGAAVSDSGGGADRAARGEGSIFDSVTAVAPEVSAERLSGSGGRWIGPAGPRVGDVVGAGYLLTEKLGEGGFGQVFQALHPRLNIPVAIKFLRPDFLSSEPILLERFVAEARLLARLNHPNVVRVWDFDADDRMPHLVLEHVEGPSLADVLRQAGRLSVPRAVSIVRDVASALAAAWELRIVHRDVKPGNILLTRDGVPKLADLGTAIVVGPPRASRGFRGVGDPGRVEGTAAYMAPEQARAELDVDFRADVYSLGATLYHMLAGRLPHPGRDRRAVIEARGRGLPPPPLPGSFRDDVPPALDRLVLRMMADRRRDRPSDYGALLADLDRWAEPSSCSSAARRTTGFSGVSLGETPIPSGWTTPAR